LLPGKTVSIAAPSSYWYLKNYPIAEIAEVIDYIIFMTYDLHGQVKQPLCDREVLTLSNSGMLPTLILRTDVQEAIVYVLTSI
jgi:hypothetical protein